MAAVFLLSNLAFPIFDALANQTATVIGDTVNIRSGPSTSYSITARVTKGQELEVIKNSNGWYNVRLSNGQVGWIAGWLVSIQSNQQIASSSKTVVITVSSANIRSGPGLNYSPVSYGKAGDRFKVVAEQGTWFKIQLNNGKQAWISSTVVKVESSQSSSQPEAPKVSEAAKEVVVSENSERLVISGAAWVNIRTGPGTNNNILTTLAAGTELTGLQLSNGWYKVRLSDQREGWIYATYTKKLALPSPVSRGGNGPLYGKVIVLDPGHANFNQWGVNPGAVGLTGLKESDVVLDISLKLRSILTAQGAKVIMTHTGTTNLTLAGRADLANANGADIFVSVHANANTNRSFKGTSTFYYGATSTRLAQSIQSSLVGQLNTRDIGILYGNFTVIKNTTMPSVLVETAFISNPEEEALLATDSFRTQTAQGIASGIQAYFK